MGPGDRRGALVRVKRFLVEAFTERLAYKLAALLVAFVLWLSLRAENPVDGDVPVRLELSLDSSLTFVGPRPQITAYVVGSNRALNRLAFDPPTVRRSFGPDTPDSVEVELTNEDVLLPPGVSATVRSVQPRRITLRFAARLTRTVPVISTVTVRPAPGFRVAGPPSITPESVTVSGDRRLVQPLVGVRTVDTVLVVRDGDPIVVPLDTTSLGASVVPATVRVRVPVVVDLPALGGVPLSGSLGTP